jgi:putative membrane-bound dehydrogenase-like protein
MIRSVPAAALILLCVVHNQGCRRSTGGSLTPEQALESFRFSEPFRIELFASEPMVRDPVEIAFDENGRAYVADMQDHPYEPPKGEKPRSRIVWLEDTDGDGKADRSGVFADDLALVSGLLPFRGGLIVTHAPDILYLKDTDGDGRADIRRTLYTGFSKKVIAEARVTNPRLGIDNWIYAANTGVEGEIRSVEQPELPPIPVRGADFRFHPVLGIAELVSGPAQFGLSFNDWGDRFITQNTVHVRYPVIPMTYLLTSPGLRLPDLVEDISDHGKPSAPVFPLTQPQEWRRRRSETRQKRYDENKLGRVEHAGGYFTAASGGTVYTGDVFPPEYKNNLFTGDVNGNLVHRDVLTPAGPTYRASRAKEDVEFLVSTDVWFRPCNFANAPDGLLYLTDMYREFIEDPGSIPEEIRRTMNFRSGDTLGRIYRIVPLHAARTRNLKPALGSATTAQLAETLTSTNGWHRQTAQRLLIERADRTAIPLIKGMLRASSDPIAQLHALWTLEGLDALEPKILMMALRSDHAVVRRHAIQLSERYWAKDAALSRQVLLLENDSDERVLFQLALSLNRMNAGAATPVLAHLAGRFGADPWFRSALLAGGSSRPVELLEVLSHNKATDPTLTRGLATLVGFRKDSAGIARLLGSVFVNRDVLTGLATGLKDARVRGLALPGGEDLLGRWTKDPSHPYHDAAWELVPHLHGPSLLRQARADALNSTLPYPKRVVAVKALAGAESEDLIPLLGALLAPETPVPVQLAAIEVAAEFDRPAIGDVLLANWSRCGADARARLIDLLSSRQQWTSSLLGALERHEVPVAAVSPEARVRLQETRDADVAKRAAHLFRAVTERRALVVSKFADVATLPGDAAHGKKAFEEHCARCHMPGREGARLGPDLSGVNNKSRQELLSAILDPSSAIDPRFTNYLITTKDGRMFDGIIGQETPVSVVLRTAADGADVTLPRDQIAEIRASSISVMPEGLESSLSRQDLADVIAYLRAGL